MRQRVILARGKAEQAHIGKTGRWSWLAVRGSNGEFLSLPHIAGKVGTLVWIPSKPEPPQSDDST